MHNILSIILGKLGDNKCHVLFIITTYIIFCIHKFYTMHKLLRCLTRAIELTLLSQNSGKIRTRLMIYFLGMNAYM